MGSLCEGRVVIVTGAGRGIGREEALEFARQGAKVVVNDLGTTRDGEGADNAPAQTVVEEIRAFGGEAVSDNNDVSDWAGAGALIERALDTFGGMDVLVNNAGILRDKMLVNMSVEDWDEVIKVHLRGTFCAMRRAAEFWRSRTKRGGPNDARIINTTSGSGLFGNVGQTNYGAAKAGVAGLTIIAAKELSHYGVTVNAFSPGALTRMTEGLMPPASSDAGDAEFDPLDPAVIIAPVVWFGSTQSRHITGQVFEGANSRFSLLEGWHRGPTHSYNTKIEPVEFGHIMDKLFSGLRPCQSMYD